VAEAIVERMLHAEQGYGPFNRWMKGWLICMPIISLIFLLSFNALERIAVMPASTGLMILLSIGGAFCHTLISAVLDKATGVSNESLPGISLCNEKIDEDEDQGM
jgi:hypothetical protein